MLVGQSVAADALVSPLHCVHHAHFHLDLPREYCEHRFAKLCFSTFPLQGVSGALTVLMRDAIRPNLMQTLEVSVFAWCVHSNLLHREDILCYKTSLNLMQIPEVSVFAWCVHSDQLLRKDVPFYTIFFFFLKNK